MRLANGTKVYLRRDLVRKDRDVYVVVDSMPTELDAVDPLFYEIRALPRFDGDASRTSFVSDGELVTVDLVTRRPR